MSPLPDRVNTLVNGMLMGIGGLIVLDNVFLHWIFALHRVVNGPLALPIEIGLVILGSIMFGVGFMREWRAAKKD